MARVAPKQARNALTELHIFVLSFCIIEIHLEMKLNQMFAHGISPYLIAGEKRTIFHFIHHIGANFFMSLFL